MNGWRWASASTIGSSHKRSNTEKQDAFAVVRPDAIGGALGIVVADGAGSTSHGGQGASIVCRTFSVELRNQFRSREPLAPSEDDIWTWIDLARDRIAKSAERLGVEPRQFACTLVFALIADDAITTAHIGDGAVVAIHDGAWTALSWPENGEYASTTFFVTDDPQPRLRYARLDARLGSVAVFTDGIERLALDLAREVPHPPFFDGIFRPLKAASTVGRDSDLSAKLDAYLGSSQIEDRTDDDKTVVLATRDVGP